MADDINMWNDIQAMDGRTKETKLLMECYVYKFQEFDHVKATECKNKFEDTYKYWGNYY